MPSPLVYDHSLAAGNVGVSCIACGARRLLSNVLIDPDGPAFRAYYCPGCRDTTREIAPCEFYGCRREHVREDE